MVRKSASVLVILGCLVPGMAAALGLGELTLHSYLNEPLKAEVDLLETAELSADQIRIRLASREDFARAGVERQYFLTSLKFELEFKEDGSTRLLLTSTERVREPFLDFLVEARWPNGRILREYTVLLDPPLFEGSGSGVIAAVKVPTSAPTSVPEQATGATAADDQATQINRDRYGSNAAAMPTAGAEYLVQRDETLWSISRRARPAGSSIHQTMLDIQRLNPEAFMGNNINRLKAGYVLRLPSSAEITEADFEDAVAEVAQQEANWQDNVETIDARRLEPDSADSSGVAGSDEDQGRLQIAGVDDDTRDNGADGNLSARMENLDRVQRDNSDLLVRVDSMEEQVDTLKRLVDLKNDQISALQSAMAGDPNGAAIPDQQLGTIDSGTDELPEPDEGLINDLDASVIGAEIEDTTPAGEQSPPVVETAPGIVELAMGYLVYIVAALAILLAGAGWLMRDKLNLSSLSVSKLSIGRRGASQDQAGGGVNTDDEFAGVELLADDELIVDEFMDDSTEGAGNIETLESFSAPDEEAYAAQFETGDALAEADIYIAYGRFPQAVDLLKAAITIDPVNTEYRVKLMEACVEMVESGEFQQQLADLQLINDDAALQRARALVDGVDGGEVWLEDLPKPSLTAADVEAARAASPAPKPAPVAASAGMALPEVDLSSEDTEEESTEEESAEDEDADESGLKLMGLDDYGLDSGDELELDDSEASDLDAGADALDLDLELELEDLSESTDDLSLETDVLDLEDDALSLEDDGLSLEDDVLSLEDGVLSLEEESGESLEEVTTRPEAEDALDLGDLAIDDPAATDTNDEDDDSDLPSFNLDDYQIEDDAPVAEPAMDDIGALEEPDASDGEELESVDLDEFDLGELSVEDENLEIEPEPELEVADEEDGGLITDFGELEIDGGDAEESDEEISFGLAADEAVEDKGLELDSLEALSDTSDAQDTELGDLDLDFEVEAEAEVEAEEEGLVFATDGDEIATKLDLARAYMDMGDHDGARSILEEVQQDGSESQQQEAQSLLDSID
jgi:pilus assembly protein FimV